MCLATGVEAFNMTDYSHLNISCITDKCMAWETIGTQELYIDDVDKHGVVRNLPREDCEGYCRRLK